MNENPMDAPVDEPEFESSGFDSAPATPTTNGNGHDNGAQHDFGPAPQAWPKEHQESTWRTLSPEARKFFADREAQIHSGITESGQKLREFQEMHAKAERDAKRFDPIFERWGQYLLNS